MNKNQVKGRIKAEKGKGKQVVGKAVGNKQMQYEGKLQNMGGKAQKAVGDLQESIEEEIEDIERRTK